MTDEVGRLVPHRQHRPERSDGHQPGRNAPSLLNVHERQIDELEERRGLNRELRGTALSPREMAGAREIGLG